MNLSDFIIIYLACGSPVGVWFYFNHGKTKNILSKSLLAALFWVFYMARLVYEKQTVSFRHFEKSTIIRQFQKNIEKHLPNKISIFTFREIVNRYIGLSVIKQSETEIKSIVKNNFSAAFNKQNEKISAKCLQRRNQIKLNLHQIYAREDFLQTIREISEQTEDLLVFLNLNLEFVKNLNDKKAEIEIENLIEKTLQINKTKAVKQREVELWNNEKLKLPTVEQTNFLMTNTKPQVIRMSTKD